MPIVTDTPESSSSTITPLLRSTDCPPGRTSVIFVPVVRRAEWLGRTRAQQRRGEKHWCISDERSSQWYAAGRPADLNSNTIFALIEEAMRQLPTRSLTTIEIGTKPL